MHEASSAQPLRSPDTPRTARLHPGSVLQCFDHFVIDLQEPEGRAASYFTVYAVEFSSQLGTGHVAFLRIRRETEGGDLDLTITDAPDMARRMQARLRALIRTVDVSRGIGTDLDQDPVAGRFERLPFTDRSAGFRVSGLGVDIEALWLEPGTPFWAEGMAGTFTPERDVLGVMIEFANAQLTVNGRRSPGRPYLDPWWEPRVGRSFGSCHIAMAETSLTPGGGWWYGR